MRTSARVAIIAIGGLTIIGAVGQELARVGYSDSWSIEPNIPQTNTQDTKFLAVPAMFREGDMPLEAEAKLLIPLKPPAPRTMISRALPATHASRHRTPALIARRPVGGTPLVPRMAPIDRNTSAVFRGGAAPANYDLAATPAHEHGIRGFFSRLGQRLHQKWVAVRGGGTD